MLRRRELIKGASVLGAAAVAPAIAAPVSRVRPGDPAWPGDADWARLNQDTGARLIKIPSPLIACQDAAACGEIFKALKNPYAIGDDPALTQTTGWVDAWTSSPSVYAVAAETTQDIVAAVNFARDNNL